MTVCNMAIEAGGKNGIIEPDDKTFAYVRARTSRPFEAVYGDAGAAVDSERVYDASTLEPCVAEPHIPSNFALARDRRNVKLDRAYIGSCTGGKLTDFIAAARILAGRKVSIHTFGRTRGSEAVISTTNRNFPGRMGSKDSRIYLASPLTAAASAVAGHIADPRDYMQ
jgi:3-isopropylmalate/(R)-2-methylmalate dehydratase large subunit